MIKQSEYQKRRRQLMGTAGEGSIILVPAAPAALRNNDVHYPYRQDSDFLYLTGFREPEAMLVLLPDGGDGQAILFCRERDARREMWDGPMAGLEGALAHYGMDQALPINELASRLPRLLQDRVRIFHDLGKAPAFDTQLIGWLNEFRARSRRSFHAPEEIVSLDHMLHEMRLFKSRGELSAMRRSAKVACEAHVQAMQTARPGMNEAQINGSLHQAFIANQCESAYLPIVGAGANACVLHYIANNQTMADGSLLLIDAGAEYDGYASDITRTFPVNGRFSAPQRALYEVVLEAQRQAIGAVKPGVQWEDLHRIAVESLTDGMLELGIMKGSREEAMENGLWENYYVHKTGHWLGLDVHDVGDYQVDGHSRELEPGMVLTIEPGIYIRADDTRVAARWRGLGIRIEDDVAVTREGSEVLTDGVPKDVDDIETLMAA
jgi:Xaa-Pro aminopeptidase